MRSTAHFKGHPLHPILVVFPIAFYTGALAIDALATIRRDKTQWKFGKYLAIMGVAGAVVAAIPGAIDYVTTIPPDSSAKKRGTKHALINVTVLVIFIIVIFLKDDDFSFNILGLELLAVLLTSIAGWMGGTLVHRNQIGIDIRYADAGKWKERTIFSKEVKIELAETNELTLNQMMLLHVNGDRIVLGKTEDGFAAFSDHCTHRGGSLAGGALICGTVQCPWHGSQFSVHTGKVSCGPAKENIKTYKLFEENGKLYLLQ